MKAAVNHNLAGLPEEMEECMDDVFLDVWEHIERFDAAKGSCSMVISQCIWCSIK